MHKFIYSSVILTTKLDGTVAQCGGRAYQLLGKDASLGVRTMKCLSCHKFVSPKYKGDICPHCNKAW